MPAAIGSLAEWAVRQLLHDDWVVRHHHLSRLRCTRPRLFDKVCFLLSPDDSIYAYNAPAMPEYSVFIMKDMARKGYKQTMLTQYFKRRQKPVRKYTQTKLNQYFKRRRSTNV